MSYENIPKDDRGNVSTEPKDYFIEVSSRNVTGALDERIVGRSLNIGNSVFETLWDFGGDMTYLTADTQLYASSDNAADTAVILLIQGLDDNYIQTDRTVTLNGQTQVALSGLLFRVHAVIVGNGTNTPLGNVYIAEADSLTLGVPDTQAKVKAKVELNAFDSGDFASWNISHNGFYTVPAGKSMHVLGLFNTTEKNCDIQLDLRARVPGGAWLSLNTIWAYQSPTPLGYLQRPRISAESDVEMRVKSGNPSGSFEANVQFVLVDD
tara:strand:+ start:92 stop:889 length:798 start_codon:yes stop_codon:yes gene_type:complete